MKKIFAFITVISLIFLFSCKSIGMSRLLSYQNGDFKAEIKITDKSETRVSAEKKDGVFTFRIITPKELAGVTYKVSGGEVYLIYNGFELKADAETPVCAVFWAEAFSLSPEKAWKIGEVSPSGTDLYECTSENVRVFIDRSELIPYRIEYGQTNIDIISFAVINTADIE